MKKRAWVDRLGEHRDVPFVHEQGRARGALEGAVAADVVEVAVRVDDEPAGQPLLREKRQDFAGVAARVDHQRLARVAVGDEVRVRLEGTGHELVQEHAGILTGIGGGCQGRHIPAAMGVTALSWFFRLDPARIIRPKRSANGSGETRPETLDHFNNQLTARTRVARPA